MTTDPTTHATAHAATPGGPRSVVLHAAARHYDLLAALLTFGRERALRERLADLARLAPSERVLDVGCGTGSLALAAKRRVGHAGTVRGVDASPEMVALARAKAATAELDVTFELAHAQALPVADASVDAVLGTLMLHHLPPVVREAFAREIRRVLRPGGRVLLVDFEAPARQRGGLVARLHRHGGMPLARVVELLGAARLRVVERGAVGASDLQFALATAPVAVAPGSADVHQRDTDDSHPSLRSLPPLPRPRWVVPAGVAAVVLAHVLVLVVARLAWATLAVGALAGAGVLTAAVLAVVHVGAAGGVHTPPRGRQP